ncbi:HAMP domain-containing sensor histidine kinase [Litoribacillus peritrichatus]|uniref:HAMP domain-containing sensor histidine kinase n=1 Tax=Litoribacillus peritrichatus TaxID=718191 RepID=UPI0031E3EED7
MTIHIKLITIILICILSVVFPSALIIEQKISQHLQDKSNEQLDDQLSLFVSAIKDKETEALKITQLIADTLFNELIPGEDKRLNTDTLLNGITSAYTLFNYVMIVDELKNITALSLRDNIQDTFPKDKILGRNLARFHRSDALKATSFIAPPTYDQIKTLIDQSTHETQWISVPLKHREKITGWVVSSLDWHTAAPTHLYFINPIWQLHNASMVLTTLRDRVILGSQPGKKWTQPNGMMFRERTLQLGERDFSIKLQVSKSFMDEPIIESRKMIALYSAFIVVISLCLIYLAVHLVIFKRIRALKKGAAMVLEGMDLQINTPHNDEIGLLESSFNKIAKQVSQLSSTLKKEAEKRSADTARSNQELDNFAYIISHDLHAQLRAIEHLTAWIEEELNETATKETNDNLELLHARIYRMEKLLNDLLEYSRINHNIENSHEVDTNRLVEQIFASLPAKPKFSLTTSKLPMFTTNEVHLEQVFKHLLSNAINHHNRSSGHIEVTCKDSEHYYEFSVIDDGPGIAKMFHTKAFNLFQTFRSRDEVKGNGMGLALIKKIVEFYGGQVSLASDEGEGTEIKFTWPKRWDKNDHYQHIYTTEIKPAYTTFH